ncbi:MAG: glycosyl hydrolase [Chloroflexi bacterium]|nr:MAG: glycosyl hydrolase [Chloroflexota bacterium]
MSVADVATIVSMLTLEEKASLCSGRNWWRTKAIERVGIPSILVSDGPHGLRKQPGEGDMHGVNVSLPATCFPPACTTASSWNLQLLWEVGAAIGEEALQEDIAVVLGPAVNIKRNPLCGRNFEYFSEDPLLAGELASAFIAGLQAQGIGACIKHFAANNQESNRMTIDVLVDERALHEIYLTAFERAIQEAHPRTIMSAYNQLNGTFCSENVELLTGILRDTWGFDGVVVTDWGACNDRVAGLLAGQDLEMPGGVNDNDQLIVTAVRDGTLDEAVLDRAVERLLTLIAQAQAMRRPGYHYDPDAHHALARKAATASAVLLKNDDAILPLRRSATLAVIGDLAKQMRYQGSGSSLINPSRVEHPFDALKARGIECDYAAGYRRTTDAVDEELLDEACHVAQAAESAIVFIGLTELAESESFDRDHMRLPTNQNVLLQRLARVQPNLVVVLFGGSPVEMPWIDQVKGILNMYLPGQAGGGAVVDLLFGDANTCGKLAETYPVRYEDTASARWFPGSRHTVSYRESIFVGYRYYDTARQAVLFPFGHGLSYTTFVYEKMALSTLDLADGDVLDVLVTVTNTGACAGEEVVQLYVHDVTSSLFRAEKELKAFQKLRLEPGESNTARLTLNRRAFAYYSVAAHDFIVESGAYDILVGASSQDIRLRETVTVRSSHDEESAGMRGLLADYYQLATNQGDIGDSAFTALYGATHRVRPQPGRTPFTVNSTLDDIKGTMIGTILYRVAARRAVRETVDADPRRQFAARKMMLQTMAELPLRSLGAFGGRVVTRGMAEGFAMLANGQYLRGTRQVLKSLPPKKKQTIPLRTF